MKIILFLILSTIISNLAFAEDKDQFKIVYFNDYAPLSWVDNGKAKGLLIDVLNEALNVRMGIPVVHEGYPWGRAQSKVKNGEADAFITVPTQERMNYTYISSEPAVLLQTKLFVSANNPKLEAIKKLDSIDGLRQYSHGNVIGHGWVEKNLRGMDVQWVPRLDQTIEMLSRGRFDILMGNSLVIRHNINKQTDIVKIIELPNIFGPMDFHLCIEKNSTYINIMDEFDQTIRQMRADGTLDDIYRKYSTNMDQ